MHARTILLSVVTFAWIGAVLLAGCTAPAGSVTPTPTPTPAMTPAPTPSGGTTFTQADNGGTYQVSSGEMIELRLAENPTTGYTWNLTLTPGLIPVNDRYLPDDPTGQLIGSGGTHAWFIETVEEGDQVITGFYRRSWEPPAGTAPDFTLTLVVGGETCGGTGDVCTVPTVPVTMPPRYHVYTEADNGKTVQEPLGETLGIRLQENPTTGYSWNLSLTKGLSPSGDEYLASSQPGQLVGAGGVRSFTLVTTEKGDQLAEAEYRRHWIPAGTVTYQDLEGGFYGIIGDDGKKYDPVNLDARFREDGLRVAFESTPVQGQAGIHMWGTPVTLDSIEEIPVFSLGVTVT